MLMSENADLRKAMAFLYLGSTIPVMAFLGYIIGNYYGQPMLGALIGTLLGTVMLWIEALRMGGVFGLKQKEENLSKLWLGF